MGADTQRNAFPGSVTNQLPRHCEVIPSLCHRLWYSPPAPPLSLYNPLICLIDALVLLKLTMLSYFLQLYRFLFLIFGYDVYDVCVCVCAYILTSICMCVPVCYGACVEVREQPWVLVLSFCLARVRVSCSPTINTRLTGLNCYAPCLCFPSLCGRIRCVLQIQTQPLTLLRQALCPLNLSLALYRLLTKQYFPRIFCVTEVTRLCGDISMWMINTSTSLRSVCTTPWTAFPPNPPSLFLILYYVVLTWERRTIYGSDESGSVCPALII